MGTAQSPTDRQQIPFRIEPYYPALLLAPPTVSIAYVRGQPSIPITDGFAVASALPLVYCFLAVPSVVSNPLDEYTLSGDAANLFQIAKVGTGFNLTMINSPTFSDINATLAVSSIRFFSSSSADAGTRTATVSCFSVHNGPSNASTISIGVFAMPTAQIDSSTLYYTAGATPVRLSPQFNLSSLLNFTQCGVAPSDPSLTAYLQPGNSSSIVVDTLQNTVIIRGLNNASLSSSALQSFVRGIFLSTDSSAAAGLFTVYVWCDATVGVQASTASRPIFIGSPPQITGLTNAYVDITQYDRTPTVLADTITVSSDFNISSCTAVVTPFYPGDSINCTAQCRGLNVSISAGALRLNASSAAIGVSAECATATLRNLTMLERAQHYEDKRVSFVCVSTYPVWSNVASRPINVHAPTEPKVKSVYPVWSSVAPATTRLVWINFTEPVYLNASSAIYITNLATGADVMFSASTKDSNLTLSFSSLPVGTPLRVSFLSVCVLSTRADQPTNDFTWTFTIGAPAHPLMLPSFGPDYPPVQPSGANLTVITLPFTERVFVNLSTPAVLTLFDRTVLTGGRTDFVLDPSRVAVIGGNVSITLPIPMESGHYYHLNVSADFIVAYTNMTFLGTVVGIPVLGGVSPIAAVLPSATTYATRLEGDTIVLIVQFPENMRQGSGSVTVTGRDPAYSFQSPQQTSLDMASAPFTITTPGPLSGTGSVFVYSWTALDNRTSYNVTLPPCSFSSLTRVCWEGVSFPVFFNTSCPLTVCAPGQYWSSCLSTDCLTCPSGTYTPLSGLTSCANCSAGTFAPLNGSSSCLNASAGHYVQSSGSSVEAPCDTGAYSLGGIVSICTLCEPGLYNNRTGSNSCAGCPAGTYSPLRGLKSVSSCRQCPGGLYSTGSADSCQSCSSPEVPNQQQTACGCTIGKMNDESGDCVPCPAGAIGAWSAIGEATCVPCPAGSNADSVQRVVCIPCSSGKYTADPAIDCQDCPDGTVASNAAPSCTNCTAGYYAFDRALCISCPPGTISGNLSMGCSQCPAGTFAPTSASSECTPCPPGQASAALGSPLCTECPPGAVASSPGTTKCLPCGPGNYSSSTGGERCAQCPLGSFTSSNGSSVCSLCPPGSVAPYTGSSTCSQCVAGTFYPETGGSRCIACEVGKAATGNGSSICAECSPGTVATTEGSPKCERCGPGRFAPGTGGVECLECPAGTASASIASSICSACAPGTIAAQRVHRVRQVRARLILSRQLWH